MSKSLKNETLKKNKAEHAVQSNAAGKGYIVLLSNANAKQR